MSDVQMTCDQAREALWPDPTGPVIAEARHHYAACSACQQFFAIQEALGNRLRRIARKPAPADVRGRVVAALSAPRPARVGRRVWWIGGTLAAAAGLTVAIGVRSLNQGDLARPFVAEAARVLTPPSAFRSNDRTEVEAWLRSQVRTEVRLPDITDARVMAGRVVNVGGVPTAAAVYEFHGMPLTYFALSSSEVAGRSLTVASEIVAASAEGFEVAMWSEPGGVRAVAAPMPRAEIRAVAVECRDKALRGL